MANPGDYRYGGLEYRRDAAGYLNDSKCFCCGRMYRTEAMPNGWCQCKLELGPAGLPPREPLKRPEPMPYYFNHSGMEPYR